MALFYHALFDGGEKVKKILLLLSLVFSVFPTPFALSREDPFVQAREQMIERDIVSRGITDKSVIEALRRVPRHLFVPPELEKLAYEDTPLPIGYGQTISQPYVVALMTENLQVQRGDKVLEIGTGSGYQAAILHEMGCKVYTVEIIKALADEAKERLATLGYDDIHVLWGDGYFGWKEHAPFDGIIVTCSVDHIPPPLLEQLKVGGRMVIPVGPSWSLQSLLVVEKTQEGIVTRDLGVVRFVPLTREKRVQ